MTANKTQQAFSIMDFERDTGKTEHCRLYAVEKTPYGSFLLFIEQEVLEIKMTAWGKQDIFPYEQNATEMHDLVISAANVWLTDFPSCINRQDVYQLRKVTARSLRRRMDSNPCLKDLASFLPKSFPPSVQKIFDDLCHQYELWLHDKRTWIVELLQPRPYTPEEANKYLPADTAAKPEPAKPQTQTDPGELDSDMLTTEQAAALMGKCTKTIQQWCKAMYGTEKMLPGACRYRGKWRIPRGDLKRLIESEQKRTEPPKKTKRATRQNPVKK